MKCEIIISYEFVEFIPDEIKDGVLYISIPYATATHKCCCGCGKEVVTPLSPTDWKLIFDGVSVSLDPSIGNWSFDCQSHYWIKKSKVRWAAKWSKEEIEAGRSFDRDRKEVVYGSEEVKKMAEPKAKKSAVDHKTSKAWQRLKRWLR